MNKLFLIGLLLAAALSDSLSAEQREAVALTSARLLVMLAEARSGDPLSTEQIVEILSREYREANDEFSRRDIYLQWREQIRQELEAARSIERLSMTIVAKLGRYDFDRKGFPLDKKYFTPRWPWPLRSDNDSDRELLREREYGFGFTNLDALFVPMPEGQARRLFASGGKRQIYIELIGTVDRVETTYPERLDSHPYRKKSSDLPMRGADLLIQIQEASFYYHEYPHGGPQPLLLGVQRITSNERSAGRDTAAAPGLSAAERFEIRRFAQEIGAKVELGDRCAWVQSLNNAEKIIKSAEFFLSQDYAITSLDRGRIHDTSGYRILFCRAVQRN